MNLDQMKKDAASRSNFAKIEKDVPTKVKFLSDDFQKKEGEYNGETIVKYEVPCIINGEEKKYQGSAKFYENCMQKATNRGKSFTDITYIITKTGEGLATRYDIDAIDTAQPVEPPTSPMPTEPPPAGIIPNTTVDGVPF